MKKFFYRVQRGDGVLSLSQRFNIPTFDLIRDNNLNAEVREGDVLFFNCPENVYCIKPQDTVDLLAKKFNVSPQEILEKNGIPYIFYGLTIKI